MYARLTTVYVKLDKIEEAINIYEEEVIPAANAQPGCCGCYLLTDRKSGKAIVLSMWTSKYDASASIQNGYYQAQLNKFSGLLISKPTSEGYEMSNEYESIRHIIRAT